MAKYNFISRARKAVNMFFPGVPGIGGIGPGQDSLVTPIFRTDAKRLDYLRAPIQLSRIKVDIAFWRQAIREAENPLLPYRVMMQQVYQDTIQNGHVFACINKRKNLTLLKEYHICDENGETDEEATALIDKKWFTQGLDYALDARFYGYSLITFGDLVDDELPNLTTVRRWDIRPDKKLLSIMQYLPSGIEFTNPEAKDPNGNAYVDWSLWVDTPSEHGVSPCGYGLLYKVALYEIILRNIIGWNSDFIEIFGQPKVWAKTDLKADEDEYGTLEEALRDSGSSNYLMTDKLTDIEFVESKGGQGTGWQSYHNMEERCMKTISKILLGHADAMDSQPGKLGSGQGAKNQKGIGTSPVQIALDEIESSDSRFITHVVNDHWLPKLRRLGIKLPVGKKFAFKDDLEQSQIRNNENQTNQADADIMYTIKQAGGEPDWKYFTDRTGIKVEPSPTPLPEDSFNPEIMNRIKNTYK